MKKLILILLILPIVFSFTNVKKGKVKDLPKHFVWVSGGEALLGHESYKDLIVNKKVEKVEGSDKLYRE